LKEEEKRGWGVKGQKANEIVFNEGGGGKGKRHRWSIPRPCDVERTRLVARGKTCANDVFRFVPKKK